MSARMLSLFILMLAISISGILCEEKLREQDRHNKHHPCCYSSHCFRDYYDGHHWDIQRGRCESNYHKHRPGSSSTQSHGHSDDHHSNSNEHSACYYDGCYYTGQCYFRHHKANNGTDLEEVVNDFKIPEAKTESQKQIV